MKRTILLFFLIAGVTISNAQSLRVFIGPAFSTMDWKSSPSVVGVDEFFEKSYTGFQAGAGIDFLKTKYFYLSSNIAYKRLGGNGQVMAVDPYGNDIGKVSTRTSLNMMSFNTSANLGIRIKERFFPYLGLGPRVEYLVSYKEKAAFLKQFEDFDELNRLMFGMLALAGIKYELDKFALGLEFHYNHNFNKLVDQTSTAPAIVNNQIGYQYWSVFLWIGYKLK
ncbi:MAG: PorT family protein [Bacteroidales bacterium]|nr:PorT family protein [Bacteroidales bacterium]